MSYKIFIFKCVTIAVVAVAVIQVVITIVSQVVIFI